MKAKLVRKTTYDRGVGKRGERADAGTVIDHPDAWQLVRHGAAWPADDECRKRCGMTDVQIAAAVQAAEKVSKGIHPMDYARYDAGEMIGYNGDGTDIVTDFTQTEEE